MRIAICDDEDQERLNIKALVKRYAPELSIVLFSSADELLTAAKTTFFPLIFWILKWMIQMALMLQKNLCRGAHSRLLFL